MGHYCTRTSPAYTYIQKYTTDPVLVHLIRRSTSDPVLVLLIPFSAILPQYLPCGYDTTASTSPTDTLQSTSAPVPDQPFWYTVVHYCPSTSPTDTLQSTTAPVPDLLIQHVPLLPQYESYWYPTVHYYPIFSPTDMTTVTVPIILICSVHNCPSTSPNDTTQSAVVPVPNLLIQHSQLLP